MFLGATVGDIATFLFEKDGAMPQAITSAAQLESDVASWFELHPGLKPISERDYRHLHNIGIVPATDGTMPLFGTDCYAKRDINDLIDRESRPANRVECQEYFLSTAQWHDGMRQVLAVKMKHYLDALERPKSMGMDALNPTQKIAAAIVKIRTEHAGLWILAATATLTPMREVAFGDLNGDPDLGIPLTFASEDDADARAAAWNARLPAGYRRSLSIVAFAVHGWADMYMDTLDVNELMEGTEDVDMAPYAPSPMDDEDWLHMDEVY